jgi:hypothetical protein
MIVSHFKIKIDPNEPVCSQVTHFDVPFTIIFIIDAFDRILRLVHQKREQIKLHLKGNKILLCVVSVLLIIVICVCFTHRIRLQKRSKNLRRLTHWHPQHDLHSDQQSRQEVVQQTKRSVLPTDISKCLSESDVIVSGIWAFGCE